MLQILHSFTPSLWTTKICWSRTFCFKKSLSQMVHFNDSMMEQCIYLCKSFHSLLSSGRYHGFMELYAVNEIFDSGNHKTFLSFEIKLHLPSVFKNRPFLRSSHHGVQIENRKLLHQRTFAGFLSLN